MLKVSREMPQTFEHRRTEHFPISQHGDQWRLHTDAGVAQATQVVTRPPNLAGPPNLAVLLTHCGQLIIREVSIFDATSCQILGHKAQNSISTGALSQLDPAGGAYIASPPPS